MSENEFEEVVSELYALQPENGVEPRLDATRMACELLGDVHKAFRMVHITGTNGKSSTARMIASLLRAHELRVGLFTSPHLVSLNERIEIDAQPVSKAEIVKVWRDIEPIVGLVNEQLAASGKPHLTFFEALTVLAYSVFAQAPVDIAVVEVGMGGEWDSTNVADGDVAVFTPIALDHTKQLGDTVAEIAHTKARIMKPGAIAVSAVQEPAALGQLQAYADELGIPLFVENAEFGVVTSVAAVGGSLATLSGLAGKYTDVAIPLLGQHQVHNAALALAAVEAFLGGGDKALDQEVVHLGFELAKSPGRLQIIRKNPTVLIDAAHNPHGAKALAEAIDTLFHFERVVGVVGVLADKDVRGVVSALANTFDEIVLTQSDSPRALPVAELREIALEYFDDGAIHTSDSVASALDVAENLVEADRGEAIVVTGSITVIGEAITAVGTN